MRGLGRWAAVGAALACALGCGAKTGLSADPPIDACGDGWDGDGDGAIDEDCPCEAGVTQVCYGGPPSTDGVGACAPGVQRCEARSDGTLGFGGCEDDVLPGIETCDDGEDEDCDGFTDCEDRDCRTDEACAPMFLSDELCDGLDNNGDGRADEGQACPQGDGPCPVAGAIRICDSYCGMHQRCRADGSWGPCIIDGVGPATTCSIHADCPRGAWCDIGECVPTEACESDAACVWESTCALEQGTCYTECFHHDDCEPPTVCDLGRCVNDPYYPSF